MKILGVQKSVGGWDGQARRILGIVGVSAAVDLVGGGEITLTLCLCLFSVTRCLL